LEQLPEFCQGNSVILKAISQSAVSYLWSTGATASSIQVSASGNYSVTATGATGCSSAATYSLNYDASQFLSSYVISAAKEANFRKSTVKSGAVGARNENGKTKFETTSQVTAAGTFVKANTINVFSGSSVANKILNAANIALPIFEHNTQCGAGQSLNIPDNVNFTITGSQYKGITIGKNSTVTFLSSNINLENIYTKENATIKFASPCVRLKICKKMQLGINNSFNPEGKDVIAFVQQDVTIQGGSTVTADIYMNGGKMTVKNAPAVDHNIMTGLFIVNILESGENTDWYWNPSCASVCHTTLPSLCQSSDRKVLSFTLVNANTDSDVRQLNNGDVIDICAYPVSVRANVCNEANIESVKFLVNGNFFKMENIPFYTLAGDNNGNYNPWNVTAGTYTITAIPYSGNNGSGTAGTTLSITVTVACSSPN